MSLVMCIGVSWLRLAVSSCFSLPCRIGLVLLLGLTSRLAELNLNLVTTYAYSVSEDLAMALLIYEAKDGLFEKAIEELRKGGATVREAYEIKITKAVT